MTGCCYAKQNNDDRMFSCSKDGLICIWDTKIESEMNVLKEWKTEINNPITCLSCNNDYLYIGYANGQIQAYDISNSNVNNVALFE